MSESCGSSVVIPGIDGNPMPAKGSASVSATASDSTVTWISMTSLASRPGTAVEPIWSIRSAFEPQATASRLITRCACTGHVGSAGTSSGRHGARCRMRRLCA
ncbi:Uncharacterised protein [Mycobacteroides abscessus subsp. abscessus]|nr:Uncharacterised protein [Mycobacteroides abscessus subsp. abscessus]